MPLGLAVIAEGVPAPGPLARDPGAGGAPGGDDGVSTVWGRTPAGVGVGGKDAPEHEELVELEEAAGLVADQHLDVWKKKRMIRQCTVGSAYSGFFALKKPAFSLVFWRASPIVHTVRV